MGLGSRAWRGFALAGQSGRSPAAPPPTATLPAIAYDLLVKGIPRRLSKAKPSSSVWAVVTIEISSPRA